MFPNTFEYYAPTSLKDAVKLLGKGNKIIAGGHSLLPLMKLRLAEPAGLVDIGHIAGLDGIKETGGVIRIGARATHASIADSALLQSKLPLLPETAKLIGDLQVRNRGTIGGSLAHADPAGDFPAPILALDADLVATGRNGERTIAAGSFFKGMLSTALRPSEILTEIRIKEPASRTGMSYQKFPATGVTLRRCGGGGRHPAGQGWHHRRCVYRGDRPGGPSLPSQSRRESFGWQDAGPSRCQGSSRPGG